MARPELLRCGVVSMARTRTSAGLQGRATQLLLLESIS